MLTVPVIHIPAPDLTVEEIAERLLLFRVELILGRGVRVYEVPIVYRARSREEGKKLTALDGLRVLRTLLRCRIA